jgi:fused signal recognition particle receptor
VPSSEGDSSGGGVGTDVLERPVDEAVETMPDLVEPEAPAYERPESARGRLARLRARLARSNTAIGKGLLALLSRGKLDEAAWEDVEDTLLAPTSASRPPPSWSSRCAPRC